MSKAPELCKPMVPLWPTTVKERLETALAIVLDHVDYTAGACRITEMVGACLPQEVLEIAHSALTAARAELSEKLPTGTTTDKCGCQCHDKVYGCNAPADDHGSCCLDSGYQDPAPAVEPRSVGGGHDQSGESPGAGNVAEPQLGPDSRPRAEPLPSISGPQRTAASSSRSCAHPGCLEEPTAEVISFYCWKHNPFPPHPDHPFGPAQTVPVGNSWQVDAAFPSSQEPVRAPFGFGNSLDKEFGWPDPSCPLHTRLKPPTPSPKEGT